MQAGEYRRALALAAHIAGGHPDTPDGAALYAQLLDIGGLREVAARVLPPQAAQAAAPRFGPASPESAILPRDARVASSGVLVGDGRAALASAAALRGAQRLWVRNGLGALSAATLQRVDDLDLAVLLLEQPLTATAAQLAPRDAHPGSAAFAVEYPAAADASPAWPALRAGFVGKPIAGTKAGRLGIDLPPGPRGGPVFDAAGRLCGIAVSGERLLPVSFLRPQMAGSNRETADGLKLNAEEIYERSLGVTLQVIVVP